jgi:hypothetical protein
MMKRPRRHGIVECAQRSRRRELQDEEIKQDNEVSTQASKALYKRRAVWQSSGKKSGINKRMQREQIRDTHCRRELIIRTAKCQRIRQSEKRRPMLEIRREVTKEREQRRCIADHINTEVSCSYLLGTPHKSPIVQYHGNIADYSDRPAKEGLDVTVHCENM